jgi:hypothetical protein
MEVWIARLLNCSVDNRRQKAGLKRKSSAAQFDGRPDWRPSGKQLTALLATCLHALTRASAPADGTHEEKRLAALRRVTGLLVEQAGSQADKQPGSTLLPRLQQLQTFIQVSSIVRAGFEGHTASDACDLLKAAQHAEVAHMELLGRLKQPSIPLHEPIK